MSIKHPEIMTRPDPQRKERAIAEALRAYRRAEVETPAAQPAGGWAAMGKGFALGACASLAVVMVLSGGELKPRAAAPDELVMLGEMKQLFGGQLQGVVEAGGQILPVVSQSGAYNNAAPIVITLKQDDGKVIRVLCYSGSTVDIPVAGGKVSVSAYAQADGKILVEGGNFLWSADKTVGEPPARIEAKLLEVDL